MTTKRSRIGLSTLLVFTAAWSVGCSSSLKTPSTADVAVSRAAVENANDADATRFAPEEMASARYNLEQANKALAAKDYKLASELANKARADAKLARAKANSAKTQAAADALQESIRVLNQELERNL